MDQIAARKTLQELIRRDDLDNKRCVDCSNPNPQWASLSFAVFICLQCAGTHRGFGVHISFVRSVSMDTWQEEQIKRMQLGGNAPFREFMKSYPANGGYTEGMNPHETYHSWAATQYRQKLDAELAGNTWLPSPPSEGTRTPNNAVSPPGRPSSAQGLRKSRASARSSTGRVHRSDSASPASFGSNSPAPSSPAPNGAYDQKAANESYFSTLGQANASRPAELPPSQGGRYQGFGNTPSPSEHPAYGLSSRAAPSLNEFRESPGSALSKSWSLFSAAVAGASRAVTENVIQPGVEKVTDPKFQASVRGYASEAGKRAAYVGQSANAWGKNAFGVDVADQVGGVVGTVKDKVGGGPEKRGYGRVSPGFNEGESSGLYQDHGEEEDFFGEYNGGSQQHGGMSSYGAAGETTASESTAAPAKKQEDWDEWKDF